ncbi:MAG: hypothetical protein ACERKN_07190 [Velocimicrobium sp.]
MKLEDCSKEELIWYIKNRTFTDFNRIESDILFRRIDLTIVKQEEVGEKADKALGKYIELMQPYEGKKYLDIPDAVIKKASEAMKEWKKLTEQSNRLHKQWEKINAQIDNIQREGEHGC